MSESKVHCGPQTMEEEVQSRRLHSSTEVQNGTKKKVPLESQEPVSAELQSYRQAIRAGVHVVSE